MKKYSRWAAVAMVVAGGMATGARADEGSTAIVDDVAKAAQLTAFGRGEMNDSTGLKNFKSPEALVAAGGILMRADKATGGKTKALEATITENGATVAGESVAVSFAADADALFDEARGLASKDKMAAIEALIKEASTVPESRGAVGGPKTIARRIGSGKTQTTTINFEPNSPASVTFRGTGKVRFEVYNNKGNKIWSSPGSWGFYNWNTGRGGDKSIEVKIINAGGPPVAYTIVTN